MSKVYLVTKGNDPEVRAACSTRVNAEAIVVFWSGRHEFPQYRINTYELDTANVELERWEAGWRWWRGHMTREGVSRWNAQKGLGSLERSMYLTNGYGEIGAPSHPRILICDVFAKDEVHAAKIANERRAQLIESGEWGET